MSTASEHLRTALNHSIDALELVAFNDGFEAVVKALEELSNTKFNSGDVVFAECLRWAAKEMMGENYE